MKQTKMRIRVGHASMQWQDTPAQKRNDAAKIFAYAAKAELAWVTGTEAFGDGGLRKALEKEAQEHGYTFYCPGGQDSWVAIRKAIMSGGSHYGYDRVVKGVARRYNDRGLVYSTFTMRGVGKVTVCATHYNTRGEEPGDVEFVNNRKINRAVGELARDKGKGGAKFFFAADTNKDDKKPRDIFDGMPLTTGWDALQKWPSTHGRSRTIDVIATFDGDGRVHWVDMRVMNDKVFPLATDHFFILGVLDIEVPA